MRQSELFTKTSKTVPRDEASINAKLLIRAGFVDKLMAGVYTLLPLGLRVYKKIEQIIREEMNAIGGQELYMPTLQPKSNWQATKRWEALDVLFRFTSYYSKIEYALGPTHEEVLSPLARKFISSYKDLPFSVYHIQNKFRDEKRAKSGMLRGREFVMKDLYSFHATQEDLDDYYEKTKEAYIKIFMRSGIGDVTYLTFASGGTFSKYSHEFQTLTKAGEDIIYICENCRIAINKEIIKDQRNKCPECENKDLKEEKAVEVGNIFKLGNKYSKPFDLSYIDSQGNKKDVIMGCYGIGLQRLMGTVVEVHHDNRGIIWPETVAPFKAHLVSLNENKEADKIYKNLEKAGIEVLYDDRKDVSAGKKLADADLIGIPYRIVVSAKTLREKSIELKMRGEEKIKLVKINKLVEYFNK